MQRFNRRLALIAFALLIATGTTRGGDLYFQTNLVSNIPGTAQVTDPNLQGAWGLSFSSTSPFWISNQASGTSTLYSANPTTNQASIVPLVVGITNQGT